MRVEYHPVEQDVAEALRHYGAVSQRLGGEFTAELRAAVAAAAAKPGRFHLIKPGFHRANLKRFPYHFELLAMNDLGEPSNATPAISDGQIFLRTDGHLYCIAEN